LIFANEWVDQGARFLNLAFLRHGDGANRVWRTLEEEFYKGRRYRPAAGTGTALTRATRRRGMAAMRMESMVDDLKS
jgi:hypothetical protein